jgi:ferritin-like metal-binding protein YciE
LPPARSSRRPRHGEAWNPLPRGGVSPATPPSRRWKVASCRDGIEFAGSEAMGLLSKSIKTMDDLFVHTLQDIYYAEKQIVNSLPKMIQKASDPQLKQAFQMHLSETENQVTRLEEVFRMQGQSPKGSNCPALDGIIEEANDIIGDVDDQEVCDAAILAAAQAVEHYEITRYGTLVAWAKQLGRNDIASLLHQTLVEEKAADEKLTKLAEANINRRAA